MVEILNMLLILFVGFLLFEIVCILVKIQKKIDKYNEAETENYKAIERLASRVSFLEGKVLAVFDEWATDNLEKVMKNLFKEEENK